MSKLAGASRLHLLLPLLLASLLQPLAAFRAAGVPHFIPSCQLGTSRRITMSNLFVYGTLMADEVLLALLARTPKRQPATLRGYVRGTVKGEAFPAILPSPEARLGHKVEGLLLQDLTARELRVLDFYEDDGYDRLEVTVLVNDELRPAMVYLWPAARRSEIDLDRPWSLQTFCDTELDSFLRDVVVPCAVEFEDEEQLLQQVRTQRLLSAGAVLAAAMGLAFAFVRRRSL